MFTSDFNISQTKKDFENNNKKAKVDDAFANKIRSIEMPEMA